MVGEAGVDVTDPHTRTRRPGCGQVRQPDQAGRPGDVGRRGGAALGAPGQELLQREHAVLHRDVGFDAKHTVRCGQRVTEPVQLRLVVVQLGEQGPEPDRDVHQVAARAGPSHLANGPDRDPGGHRACHHRTVPAQQPLDARAEVGGRHGRLDGDEETQIPVWHHHPRCPAPETD